MQALDHITKNICGQCLIRDEYWSYDPKQPQVGEGRTGGTQAAWLHVLSDPVHTGLSEAPCNHDLIGVQPRQLSAVLAK